MEYHVQVKMVMYRQIEISSDERLQHNVIQTLAEEKAQHLFGEVDVVEVQSVEVIGGILHPIEAAQPSDHQQTPQEGEE